MDSSGQRSPIRTGERFTFRARVQLVAGIANNVFTSLLSMLPKVELFDEHRRGMDYLYSGDAVFFRKINFVLAVFCRVIC